MERIGAVINLKDVPPSRLFKEGVYADALHDIDLRPDALFTREMTQDFLARGYILFESVQIKKDGTHVPVEISSRITE